MTVSDNGERRRFSGCAVWVLIAVVVLFVIVVRSNTATPPDSQEAPIVVPTLTATAPAASVMATILETAYENNQVGANARYKGRKLSIVGSVFRVIVSPDGYPCILLTPSADDAPDIVIQCVWPQNESDKIAALKPDQAVTVTGMCHGMSGNYLIVGPCTLHGSN